MSDRAAQLAAELQADPAFGARVLRQTRIAVRRAGRVYLAGPLEDQWVGVLGSVACDPADGWQWSWWLSLAADVDQPSGLVETEAEAWTALTAALEQRGWAVVEGVLP